jgi:hypothetical protein
MSSVFVRCAVNEMDGTFLKYFQKLLGVDGAREGELQAAANDRLADALQDRARSGKRAGGGGGCSVVYSHTAVTPLPTHCRTAPGLKRKRGGRVAQLFWLWVRLCVRAFAG